MGYSKSANSLIRVQEFLDIILHPSTEFPLEFAATNPRKLAFLLRQAANYGMEVEHPKYGTIKNNFMFKEATTSVIVEQRVEDVRIHINKRHNNRDILVDDSIPDPILGLGDNPPVLEEALEEVGINYTILTEHHTTLSILSAILLDRRSTAFKILTSLDAANSKSLTAWAEKQGEAIKLSISPDEVIIIRQG